MNNKSIILVAIIISFFFEANSQCYPDRHNTNWFDGWQSCEKKQNPNSVRGNSHWILYDFTHLYKLQNLHIWNSNDPENLNNGVKDIVIDYSIDGNTWFEFDRTSVPIATGKSIYEGIELLNFNGLKTRYLLITALNNFGGECTGFSEMKIEVAPITGTELVNFDIDCDEKNGRTEISWSLLNDSKSIAFDVERSYDGEKWQLINSTGEFAVQRGNTDYSFTDSSDKDAFYRVKVIEKDGKTAISEPAFCAKGNLTIDAYPNPFNDHLQVEILSPNEDLINYSLSDILGRVVLTGFLEKGSKIKTLNFSDLNIVPGNYFLEVVQTNRKGQIKLVKLDSNKN